MIDQKQIPPEAGSAAENEVAKAKAALLPFAKAADCFDEYKITNPEEWFVHSGVQGGGVRRGEITVGDLRRAREIAS